MKNIFRRTVNSLAFRVLIPFIIITLLSSLGLYIFVLRSISDFTETHINQSFEYMSHHIYNICDSAINDLIKKGLAGNERAGRVKKGITIGIIEDYMKQNNLKGAIIEKDGNIWTLGDISFRLIENIEKNHSGDVISKHKLNGKDYFANHLEFEPWDWHIVFTKEAIAYSDILKKVNIMYGITGLILSLSTVLFLYYLNKAIWRPMSMIIDPIKKGEQTNYKGILEFEFLSDTISQMLNSLKSETGMLNNIYHIAATKRGEAFFDEVAMAISRILNLHSLIARLNPDGQSERVISMYLNNEISKGMDIALKGTPCENVIRDKHMCIIEKDAHLSFPEAGLLQTTMSDSFIGFAIFNRRGDVIGVVNAFGKQRSFSETDIKVLQTIGQMVAIEFERLDEEKEKETIQEQLYQARKMEAIGTLAGGVAHDFNNMLQGILGYASLIKIRLPKSDPIFKSIEIIEQTAEKAAVLTHQLLGFARKGKFLIETFSMNNVVDDVLKIITRTFDKAIEIKTTPGQNLLKIEGDRSQITNALLNLCLNAKDAMPDGGLLHISTCNREFREEDIACPLDQAGLYVQLKVADTGAGIDEKTKNHIFEPFFTTKEKGKGTGMGLAMVYGIVKNHDGFITVDSEEGKGSVFSVYFPASGHDYTIKKQKVDKIIYGKGTILLVDDEDIIREVGREILEELGYTVIEASNGLEAVDIYIEKKPQIDLVILDLIMPKMGGKETSERLKMINPDVKILISTGYAVESQIGQIFEDDGSSLIRKPYKISEIAEKVRRLIYKPR